MSMGRLMCPRASIHRSSASPSSMTGRQAVKILISLSRRSVKIGLIQVAVLFIYMRIVSLMFLNSQRLYGLTISLKYGGEFEMIACAADIKAPIMEGEDSMKDT